MQGINQRISEDDLDNSLLELEWILEAKYEEPEDAKPDLQHILTETNETNKEYIEDIKNIKDKLKLNLKKFLLKLSLAIKLEIPKCKKCLKFLKMVNFMIQTLSNNIFLNLEATKIA